MPPAISLNVLFCDTDSFPGYVLKVEPHITIHKAGLEISSSNR